MSRRKRDPFDLSSLNTHLTHTSAPSTPQSSHTTVAFQSPSRIPLYVANGVMPHHNSPMRSSRSTGSSTCGIHDSGYSSNLPLHLPPYHSHIDHHLEHHMPPYRIVPQSIQLQHQQHMLLHTNVSRKSTPSSRLTTPLTSGSNTPNSSHRPSLSHHGCVRSATLPAKLPASNLLHGPQTAKGFRYDEYMPLCALQASLQKGQVLEGVLRINPKNYEDAYISAPDEEMDIYVVGTNDRSHALNGDKVRIELNPSQKWRVRYEILKDNWKHWQTLYQDYLSKNQLQVTVKYDDTQEPSGKSGKKKRTRLRKKKSNSLSQSEGNNETLATGDIDGELISQLTNDAADTTSTLLQFETEKVTKLYPDLQNELRSLYALGGGGDCLDLLCPQNKPDYGNFDGNEDEDDEDDKIRQQEKRYRKNKKRAEKKKAKKQMKAQQKSLQCTPYVFTHSRASSSSKNDDEQVPKIEFQMETYSSHDPFITQLGTCHASLDETHYDHQVSSVEHQMAMHVPLAQIVDDPSTCYESLNETPQQNKNKTPKSKLIDGLPREILQLSSEQLLQLPFGRWCVQKTGKVTEILEHNHSRICGGLVSFDSGVHSHVKFIPVDNRIPRILIPFDECPYELILHPTMHTSTLFLAQITHWPQQSRMPFGKIVTQVGKMGEIDSETKMLLTENDVIDEPFPEEVEQQLSQLLNNWSIDETERSYRRDFTNECVFTIDPLTARDLDDALSIAPVTSNTDSSLQLFDVGVHIADVSFFIPENSLLDKEAQRRSTSFYLVHRVIHMLPRIIAEKACSLTPGEDKLTFSVVWRMDAQGNIHDTWFGRSIIRSSIKLAYEHALKIINNEPLNDLPQIQTNKWNVDDICTRVNQLHKIASNLRRKRFENGALEINKTKFSFFLEAQTGLPTGFTSGVTTVANSLVEEFMLLANISVAKKIYSSYPLLSLLRNHPPPDAKLLRDLNSFCSNFAIKLDSSTSKSLQKSLTPLKEKSETTYKVVSHFLLRAMQQASYICSGNSDDAGTFHHFALNEPFYTHFTSPIRRYPDVLVHRLLAASLGYCNVISLSPSHLQQIANHCNKRKTASRLVSEGSQKFFLLLFIKSSPIKEIAVVTQVLDRSFDAILLTLDLKCRVYMDQLDEGTRFKYDRKTANKSLKIYWPGESEAQVISATSQVKLLVTVPDETPLKVKTTLLRPDIDI